MRLHVSGLEETETPRRFMHLFGRYIYGFKPWTHCVQCLVTSDSIVRPTMKNGPYELKDHLFYLCGVGYPEAKKLRPELKRKYTNLHLAVRPAKGSVARKASPLYGVEFVIEEAEEIPIEALPDDFCGLGEKHARCKNFQFGYQMFDVGHVDLTAGEPVHRLRERWLHTPGIPHDENGCMAKPA